MLGVTGSSTGKCPGKARPVRSRDREVSLCRPRAPLGGSFSFQAEEDDQSRCQKPATCERSGRNSQGKEESISEKREGIGVKRDGNRRCR